MVTGACGQHQVRADVLQLRNLHRQRAGTLFLRELDVLGPHAELVVAVGQHRLLRGQIQLLAGHMQLSATDLG